MISSDALYKVTRAAGMMPVVMLLISIGALGFGAYQAKEAYVAMDAAQEAESSVKVSIEKTSLTATEYATIAETFARLHPNVKFVAEKDAGLRIYVEKSEHYQDWIYAMSVLHARQPGVIWDVNEFCVGRCKRPAEALIKGIRQSVSVSGGVSAST